MPKKPRAYTMHGLAGLVQRRPSKQTGSLVSIYCTEQAGFEPEGDPWTVVCEGHGETVTSATLVLARWDASHPTTWCEACRNNH
jgi:hypothetical protein